MKIHTVGAKLFHAYGQTRQTREDKANYHFSQFCEHAKIMFMIIAIFK